MTIKELKDILNEYDENCTVLRYYDSKENYVKDGMNTYTPRYKPLSKESLEFAISKEDRTDIIWIDHDGK